MYIRRSEDIQKTSRTSSERLMYVQFTSCVYLVQAVVDGFSRKILWLKLEVSNNNPKVIGEHCLESV